MVSPLFAQEKPQVNLLERFGESLRVYNQMDKIEVEQPKKESEIKEEKVSEELYDLIYG